MTVADGKSAGNRARLAAARRRLAAAAGAARTGLAAESVLVAAVAVYAIGMMVRIRGQVNQDAWLALLSGREVAEHGLPHRNGLTVWAHGAQWVDQQWLAQLTLYEAWRVAGFALAALVHVALTTAAFAGAVTLARRLGASSLSTLVIVLPATFLLVWDSWQVRAQSFAYPLFVAVLWLLATDSRRSSQRVLLALPLLMLWANLHGSVVVGVALVGLRGLMYAVERIRARDGDRRWVARAALLVVAPPLCLFVSPYGHDLLGYYHRTLFNSTFGAVVTEWEPIQLSLATLPFFGLVFLTFFLAGRFRARLTAFEVLAVVTLGLLGFEALRNVVWFTLAALALLPVALEELLAQYAARGRDTRLNFVIALGSVVAVVVVAGGTAARPDSWFERSFPGAAARTLAGAAAERPGTRIFTDERHADWLLWHYPSLRGRIALDARFELLSRDELIALRDFRNRIGADSRRATRGYGLLLLSRETDRKQIRALLAEPRTQARYDDGDVVVVARG